MRRVVLFTGGSASNLLARALESAGVAVTNVVSVFDNGGSTGKLRRIADLPAMGDVRNRICALASSATPEAARMRSLFLYRLAKGGGEAQLREELEALTTGSHRLTRSLHPTRRQEALEALSCGCAALPPDFALARTSVGNLLILGRYQQTRSFLGALDWAASLLEVRSRVLPVTLESVHLGAELEEGRWLIGQAALTSEDRPPQGVISRLALLQGETASSEPARDVAPCPRVLEEISTADAVVFGFGSFYSSVLPHLLVSGVAAAIARRAIPRIFLVNPTTDRETDGMTVADIVDAVAAHAGGAALDPPGLLTHLVHFAGDRDLAIPAGDLSRFADAGGAVLVESAPLAFEEVARRATALVLATLPPAAARERAPREPGYPVVLLDLDHTLYDYASLRRGAVLAALSTFCQAPEATCDLLLEHLVTPTTHVLRELGLPDLRREWNCPAFFAWASLLDRRDSRERAIEALEQARTVGERVRPTSPFETRRLFHTNARTPSLGDGWRELAAEALRLATEGDDPFARQLAAFDEFAAAHAELLPGAHALLEGLADDNARAIVVTEGNSSVQRTKLEYLGLEDLVTSSVVADQTLGAAALVEEIFLHSTAADTPTPLLAAAYDALVPFLVKTPVFYGKLVHSLVAAGPEGLETAIEDAVFLSSQEWDRAPRPRVATVGDRYHKDLQPLLAACSVGASAFRVAQGKYSTEFPLREIRASGLPVPSGHFDSLTAVRGALLEWAQADGPVVSRPRPALDRRILEALADSAGFLSPAAAQTLARINADLGRHNA